MAQTASNATYFLDEAAIRASYIEIGVLLSPLERKLLMNFEDRNIALVTSDYFIVNILS